MELGDNWKTLTSSLWSTLYTPDLNIDDVLCTSIGLFFLAFPRFFLSFELLNILYLILFYSNSAKKDKSYNYS